MMRSLLMQAVLIHLSGGKQNQREEFGKFPISIGRSSSNDLVLKGDDRRASSRHAELCSDVSGFFIRDLGTTNGTFVNGLRVKQARLNAGDIIEFGLGGPKLRFETSEANVTRTIAIGNKSNPNINRPTDHNIPDLPVYDNAQNAQPAKASEKEFGRATVQLMPN